jgi:hypothetical protein
MLGSHPCPTPFLALCTDPPLQGLRQDSAHHVASSDLPSGPARLRVAPRAHGDAAGGHAPGSRPVPRFSTPRPPRARVRRFERATGHTWAGSALQADGRVQPVRAAASCDHRAVRRARGPNVGPVRRRWWSVTSTLLGGTGGGRDLRSRAPCTPLVVYSISGSLRAGKGEEFPPCRSPRLLASHHQIAIQYSASGSKQMMSTIESPIPGLPCHVPEKET